MIIYFTGQPASGKTTLAKQICKYLSFTKMRPIVIDGDELRAMTQNFDYTDAGRHRNLQSAHDIALFLEKNGFTPIVAMVSPFLATREELKARAHVLEFYTFTTQRRERSAFHVTHYQQPVENYTPINTDCSEAECVEAILETINKAIVWENSPLKSA